VGIKTAQLGSVFDVFGPEASKELAKAKIMLNHFPKGKFVKYLTKNWAKRRPAKSNY